jgi:hypothetical protein
MIPLMEMFMRNGEAMRQMTQQFGISTEQTEKAMEALMPAFSEALKRNTANPVDFMKFMQAMAGGYHANYFEHPDLAFSGSGLSDGNAILGHLFGSKEVSRAIAANAAHMSGLSQSILKQMLPALAPMILGGLYKQMTGDQNPGGHSGTTARHADAATNPLGWILEQMSGGATQTPSRGPSGMENPWGKIFEEMMGGGKQTMPQPGPGNPWGKIFEEMMRGGQQTMPQPGPDNPWGKIFEEMMGGAGRTPGGSTRQTPSPTDNPLGQIFEEMLRGGTAGTTGGSGYEREMPDNRPEPEAPPESGRKGGLEGMFGDMFETGRKVQKDYQRGIESIFDQYIDAMRKG